MMGSFDFGGDDVLRVSNAWVPSADQTGIAFPFLMTIKNGAEDSDALLRVGRPVANFVEKHAVDPGEGAPAMRVIPSIPTPANKTVEFKSDGYHVMPLRTRQRLAEGETFTCSLVFLKVGTKETEVPVSHLPQSRSGRRAYVQMLLTRTFGRVGRSIST